jgi:putative ABC transport system permease protein
MMETLLKDIRYGARTFIKRPGFTIIAIITLALGIGPTTAIFSLINGVLLEPLPYKDSDKLVMMWRNNPQAGWREFPFSVPNFVDYRDRNEAFDAMAAFTTQTLSLTGDAEPEVIQGSRASSGLFATVGVEPALGRAFQAGEDQPGASPVAVLSNGLWARRFGSDPNAIGKTITIEGQAHTIIGVMPAGREFPTGTQVWAPLNLDTQQNTRGRHFLKVVARLKSDTAIRQAESQMNAIAEQLEQEYPQVNSGSRVELVGLDEFSVTNVKTPLLVLFGAVGFLLLIACANVANLLLVRAAGRTKEIAVRTALGASRFRLLRQLLTESVLLTATGGAVGLLLAAWVRDMLVNVSSVRINRIYESGFDLRVFAFTLSIVLLTGVIFGLAPAFKAGEKDLRDALKEGSGRASTGPGGHRLRNGLIVAEISLSLMLLVGAGLLIRSFANLLSVDPGFNPKGVLTFNVVLPGSRYPQPGDRLRFIERTIADLRAIPGVTSAASAGYVPLENERASRRFAIGGQPLPEPGKEPLAVDIPVSADYFKLLDIPVLAGRAFTERETPDALTVAVVNESFAQKYFLGENPVGKQIQYYSARPSDPMPPPVEVVGVVRDVRQANLEAAPEPIMYTSQSQRRWSFMTFMARTDQDPMQLVGAVKGAIQSIDKDLPISKVATLDQLMSASISQRRGLMILLGAFAALALILAGVGIYGVMSYSVSQRTHEIGIRMALGARASDVIRLVVRQGLVLALAGVAIGIVGALALTRLLTSLLSDLLFNVGAADPVTFLAIPILVLIVALGACFVPAHRATRVDPMEALRYE